MKRHPSLKTIFWVVPSFFLQLGNAHSQLVNFPELERHTIIVNLVYGQTLRLLDQGGRIVNNENHQEISLQIRTHDLIDQNVSTKIVDKSGKILRENKSSMTAQLRNPTKWRYGEMLFSFEDENLVRLQTHDKGAFRLVISVKRRGASFDCKVNFSVLSEDGDKSVKTTSFAGTPIEIIVATPKSSTCRIIRPSSQ